MKRTIIAIIAVVYALSAAAQFDKYFSNQTLRVDYYRDGCKDKETIRFKNFIAKPGEWAGSTTHLLDPFNYGAHRVMVVDAATKAPLYSRTYNSLYHEYIATKKGKKEVKKVSSRLMCRSL